MAFIDELTNKKSITSQELTDKTKTLREISSEKFKPTKLLCSVFWNFKQPSIITYMSKEDWMHIQVKIYKFVGKNFRT